MLYADSKIFDFQKICDPIKFDPILRRWVIIFARKIYKILYDIKVIIFYSSNDKFYNINFK